MSSLFSFVRLAFESIDGVQLFYYLNFHILIGSGKLILTLGIVAATERWVEDNI